ncbi:alpha-1,3-mannosyl-glycoprotein 4-beta-N-acetylglucosaminyltransferase B-like [Paramacrobiotus metropolitanus]|uniref:alpha-1,3-mannosyl-glycoprotein 4-beta-N-acetylglucosaminyltransferase B-like n=1 Tax=Paramacrobiotus metropolitanus TaxID=2943436 RepID=UPI0024465098|nr:alpha-1,3-mannosyl-glycoprotein 4-beta-N-acetylglucosaminyltransferase B-like [Paramacrobiotus metropolitanus]XP_055338025.1 alpha-1,3-mannosyl-glycoprotein 4-beta-N-acetylglucosaminyltransferase B-like [Paramacrobiotus metropolitanus]XP_055338026.1 alpha-1,3-mannosyl-glycoprotein 4-beta-N-acetylglucosaminyltransferase B-like [Paramacrobiotus metropolitanus]XP_055338027.1 alpha-1,3-mannosyl-glycoprotein 4-beta-N-acetylglucosaminyltransferase B-like [Paramacrobiotus metropolitanus]
MNVVLRRKSVIIVALTVFLLPYALLNTWNWFRELRLTTSEFMARQISISDQLNLLKDKFSHAEYLLHLRQKRLHFLNMTQTQPCNRKVENNSTGHLLRPEDILSRDGLLEIPTVFQHMPHILDRPDALIPRILIGKGRQRVSLVIGVPTVQRTTHNYVDETLESLLRNLNESEEADVVVILMVADITNLAITDVFINELRETFALHIEKGTLEILAPSPSYYPDFDKLPPTLGDPPERMKWRTKQTLDFAYLMMYAHTKGTYYLQLEDDVVTKPNYATKIKTFVDTANDFIMAEFASLGFIGKLFRSSELPTFVEFILLFYETKPVDWLLTNYLFVKVCLELSDTKYCPKAMEKAVKRFKPALFQHMGVESSLKGKVQKLREKDFGKVDLFVPHENNPSTKKIWTSLKVYQSHSLEDAYNGKNYFWALNPQPADTVTIEFKDPIIISSYLFKSGNAEHPTDQFYDAVVEVATGPGTGNETYTWEQVGNFRRGIAEGALASKKPSLAIRIRAVSESAFWVTLREIWIQTVQR